MPEDRYQKAVAAAHVWKKAGEDWERRALSEAVATELMKDDPPILDHNLKVLIESPENPKEAWNALNLMAQELLRVETRLPPRLAHWIADRLDGKRPRSARGADKYGTRDLLIQVTIERMAAVLGLPPTRARSKGDHAGDGESVCDAVGEVWGLGYKAVEGIWNERPSVLTNSAKQKGRDT